jgi:hypothetical protein
MSRGTTYLWGVHVFLDHQPADEFETRFAIELIVLELGHDWAAEGFSEEAQLWVRTNLAPYAFAILEIEIRRPLSPAPRVAGLSRRQDEREIFAKVKACLMLVGPASAGQRTTCDAEHAA